MAGASGLIGTALSSRLSSDGHDVVRLVRRAPSSPSEIPWDPATGTLDPACLDGADAVINLSGANIGARPWTPHRIDELFRSRLDPTRTLAAAMRRVDSPPLTFISQSGAGYYGDAGRTLLTESSPAGQGIMARICVEWEAAAHEAPSGVRVVTPRTAVVLSRSGGALGRLLPLLRAGIGGPLGSGRQYWPWITLPDLTSAFGFLLTSGTSGPVNVAAPETSDVNTMVTALLRVPAPALRLVMGKLADELLLASQRIEPTLLQDSGFTWQHPSIASAADWVASGK